jgi:hypothetical protein
VAPEVFVDIEEKGESESESEGKDDQKGEKQVGEPSGGKDSEKDSESGKTQKKKAGRPKKFLSPTLNSELLSDGQIQTSQTTMKSIYEKHISLKPGVTCSDFFTTVYDAKNISFLIMTFSDQSPTFLEDLALFVSPQFLFRPFSLIFLECWSLHSLYEFIPILSSTGTFVPFRISNPPSVGKLPHVSLFFFVHFSTCFKKSSLNRFATFLQLGIPSHSRIEIQSSTRNTPFTLSARWWGDFYKHLELFLDKQKHSGIVLISDPLCYSSLLSLFHLQSTNTDMNFLNVLFWTKKDYPKILDSWVRFYPSDVLEKVCEKYLIDISVDQPSAPQLKRKRNTAGSQNQSPKKQKLFVLPDRKGESDGEGEAEGESEGEGESKAKSEAKGESENEGESIEEKTDIQSVDEE